MKHLFLVSKQLGLGLPPITVLVRIYTDPQYNTDI